jgi:S1-C subfamily serine protease
MSAMLQQRKAAASQVRTMRNNSAQRMRLPLGLSVLLALHAAFAVAGDAGMPVAPASVPAMRDSQSLNATSLAFARDAVLPHVVSILVVREDFSGGEARLSLTGGTGTIVSADGFIATNAHVTENGKRFRVVLNDQREFAAELVGTDAISDLAVLKIVGSKERFGYAQFATDLSALKPGDTVLAMGAPWGMRDSVSAGVVNHTARLMASLFEDEADYEQSLNATQSTARFYAWIQHDASISPGNSGGPLVDLAGRIVGVNTRGGGFGGDMAFSIPGPIAANVVNALIKERRVKRSEYGFNVRSLRGTGFTEGALISTVVRGSAADKAGLRAGDRVLSIDGKVINLLQPEQVPEFRRQLSERPIGAELRLALIRNSNGQAKQLSINLRSELYNDQKLAELEVPHWGASVSEITNELARTMLLDSNDGILLRTLRTGGPAAVAQPAIQAGDRIVQVDGQRIKSLPQFQEIVSKQTDLLDAKPVKIEIDRNGQSILSVLKPTAKRVIEPNNPELSKYWAGWEVQPVPATLAEELGLPEGGFRITRIYRDSPAAKAGAQIGDLITATGANPVKPSGLKETAALDLRIRNAETPKAFLITVFRAGKARQLNLDLIEQPLPTDKAEKRWNDQLSLTVRALTFYDRVQRKLATSQNGVIIDRVESGGFAGLAHLQEGDLLIDLGGIAIADLSGFETAVQSAQRSNVDKLSFLIMRGADTRLLFVDAPWRERISGHN